MKSDDWTDSLDLCVLRLLERRGPLSGAEIDRELTYLLDTAGRSGAIYPLMHRLEVAGWVVPDRTVRPPRYALTQEGRDAAERLASEVWPRASARFERLSEVFRTVFGERVGELS